MQRDRIVSFVNPNPLPAGEGSGWVGTVTPAQIPRRGALAPLLGMTSGGTGSLVIPNPPQAGEGSGWVGTVMQQRIGSN
jgi:hypothetical protein